MNKNENLKQLAKAATLDLGHDKLIELAEAIILALSEQELAKLSQAEPERRI